MYRLKDADQKHSSVVAKVHYQKRRSRKVAERAHKCLQKLQGTKSLQVDEEVNTRFGNSSSSLHTTIHCTQSECTRPKNNAPLFNRFLNQRRLLRFTSDEDGFLRKGIGKQARMWTLDCYFESPQFSFFKTVG